MNKYFIIIASILLLGAGLRGNEVKRIEPVTTHATIQRTNATDVADGMVVDIKGDYQAQVVADAPTFYWKLDNDYTDAMGLATIGTGVSGVFGTAKYGSASASVSGTTTGYVNIPHHSSMNFSTNVDFTLETWIIKTAGAASRLILDHRSSSGVGWFLQHQATDEVNFGIGSSGVIVGPKIPEDGNWHHIVVAVTRAANVVFYLDSIATVVSTTTNAVTNPDATIQATIGGRSYSQPAAVYFGSIDEVAIYRRVLTQAEVTKHYLNGMVTRSSEMNTTGGCVAKIIYGSITTVHTPTVDSHVDTFGTTTSYTRVEHDGTITFAGNATVWNDLNVPLAGAKVPAVNAPTWTSYTTNLNGYTFAVNDYADLASSEVLHSYKQGTDYDVHTHIITRSMDSTNKTVKYVIYYSRGNTSSAMSSEASITGELTISANTPTFTHAFLEIGTISGATTSIGQMIKMRLKRIASSVSEPTLDPFVEQVGIHYEEDTVGSRQESTKY